MKVFLVLTILLSLVLSENTCADTEVYVKVSKKCPSSRASEESYEIYSGETLLETSLPFANSEFRVSEYCLAASTNNQYKLRMKDSYGDSWGYNTYIQIEGEYGNVVFKNFMTEKSEEDHPFSLYYAFKKGQEWKVEYGQTSTPSGWTALEFSDSAWKSVNLASPAETTSGTQYFRKTFTGLANMAAYELEMNYKYGIVAYINGNEIFRDNMPAGEVTYSTEANGSYSNIAYRGFIRPAAEVAASNSVLAVELHFLNTAPQTTIDFDAYLAIYASSIADSQCYVYGYTSTMSAETGMYPDRIFNFDRSDYFYAGEIDIPVTINFEFSGPRPLINGVRVWPYSVPDAAPGSFKWQGTMDSASTWTDIITTSGNTYESMQSQIFNGYFNANLYKFYRIADLNPSLMNYMYIYEMHPVVCATLLPTSIPFESETYTFYAKYEEVNIKSTINEFTNCTIQPALPNGVSLDSNTCTISGIATESQQNTPYTVTAVINGKSYSGTFNLILSGCEGSLVTIHREYKTGASNEAFTIKNAITQEVVLEVARNSGQPSNQDQDSIICLTGTKYTVTLSSSSSYWHRQSFLYINAMLSGDEHETILRVRYDAKRGAPSVYNFNGAYSISPVSQWYYKMGEVPSNWNNDQTSGWQQATKGTFPESSNQIQLYKNTFNVDSITDIAGFVISLRYKYGCIIYLNSHEVFRNGVDGELSTSSLAETSYTDVLYRQISLPVKTMTIGDSPAVEYIKQGSNTIAIALVAINGNQKASVFDCALRLMGDGSSSRAFNYVITSENISGSPDWMCYLYYAYNMYGSCKDNHWTIQFDDDRREWISSTTLYLHYTQTVEQPKQFTVKARNSNTEEWTTIKTITGMTWSLVGQQKKIWLENNKPYNQYRFENFATGSTSACSWKIGSIDLSSDSTTSNIPALSYPANIEIYKTIEMGEVYPNSDYYYDYSVEPALPTGISIDANNGMISGTCNEEHASSAHTITAKKFGGDSVTVTINFAVGICTGGKGLVSYVIMSDTFYTENSWKLYKGKGTTGEVVQSLDMLKIGNALNYADFCLDYDIYTVQLSDEYGDGMSTNTGYYLTVDLGSMILETGQLANGPKSDNSIATSFTSNIPFQIEYSEWKILNADNDIDNNWTSNTFDDSTWAVKKAAEFGPHIGTTAYIRHEVNIPDIADYHVLNVHIKYTGGIAAYFNGRKVARFNLEENFDSHSEALAPHDANLYSQFHIVLATVGGVTGKNTIAFEVHRNNGQSDIVFDGTGIFAVNDCSVVVDSYSSILGDVFEAEPKEFFDLIPYENGYIANTIGSKIEWIVENLEGTKYNSFGFQSTSSVSELGFSVYGRWTPKEDYISAIAEIDQEPELRRRITWPMAVGLAGFKEFKFEIDSPASNNVHLSTFVMLYCKPSGTDVCPGIDDYPAVGEGQISPAACAEGFRGYSYRECKDGQLSEIKTDKCFYKEPDKLTYEKDNFIFVMNTHVSSGIPTVVNIVDKYYIQDNVPLPAGLNLNEQTGEISGTPTVTTDLQSFTIRASNPGGETVTIVNISIRKGQCPPEGVFEATPVDETFVYNCALQGSYVGTQKRKCVLGEKDGVWGQASGFCMPVFAIVIIVLVVILVIVIIVLVILRTRKTKAIGGVKGKSAKVGKKKTTEKTKAVKV